MDALGWILFSVGSLCLVIFAFFGVGGGISNLPGTLVGVATLISGAVFIAADRIERAIKGELRGVNLPKQPKTKAELDKSEEVIKIIVITGIVIGVIVMIIPYFN